MAQTLKAGTRIEINGCPAIGGFAAVAPEAATIVRWTAKNGPQKNHVNGNPGWHIVRYADGRGEMCAHESRFRVIDNRV